MIKKYRIRRDKLRFKSLKPEQHKESVLLLLVLFIGFILRLLFNPGIGYNDEFEYASSAYRIFINSEAPTNLGALRMGIILPIGVLIKIFGFKMAVFSSFMLFISTINIFLVFVICRQIFNSKISLAAALFMAFLPIEILCSSSLLPDSIIQLYLLLSALIYNYYRKGNNIIRYPFIYLAGAGFFIGMAYSTKEIGLFFLISFMLYMLLCKERLINIGFLLSGFIVVIVIELFFSYLVWGDLFARYTNQSELISVQSNLTEIHTVKDFFRRFFLIYPYQLFFPLQKSGNQLGIYYLLAVIIIIIFFKEYLLKKNALTFFLVCIIVYLFFLNFTIIQLKPLAALIRPQTRYLMPINGLISIVLAKLLWDLMNKLKLKLFKTSVFFICITSLMYLGIILNATSPCTFNNPYYYSKELSTYIIENRLDETDSNIYCSFDVMNYYNFYTGFQKNGRLKYLEEIESDSITPNDFVIINEDIFNSIVKGTDYENMYPEVFKLITGNLNNSISSLTVKFQLSRPVNKFNNILRQIEKSLGISYFTSYKHHRALVLINK